MLFKGKRVYKNVFSYQADPHDTESALLSHEMREKRAYFYFDIKWRCSLVRYNFVILSPELSTSRFLHRVLQGLTWQLRQISEGPSYLARIAE